MSAGLASNPSCRSHHCLARAVRRRSSPPPLTYDYGASVEPAPTSLPAQTVPKAQFTDQQQTQPEISQHTIDEARGYAVHEMTWEHEENCENAKSAIILLWSCSTCVRVARCDLLKRRYRYIVLHVPLYRSNLAVLPYR